MSQPSQAPGATNIAQPWYEGGCSVVPIRTDGSKRPVMEWKRHQEARPSLTEVQTWWRPTAGPTLGVAVICGQVSGNLEMLEIEGRATSAEHLERVAYQCHLRGIGDLWNGLQLAYCEWSPSGGMHLLYRISDHPVPGNTKLAQNRANECLAETRGEGGYVIVAPTPGHCHPSGEQWRAIAGTPGTIPTINWSQRQTLHSAITAALDETPPPEPEPARLPVPVTPLAPGELRPGDDFNIRATWEEILLPQEWIKSHTRRGETFWIRPGKNARDGHSASTGYKRDADRIYIWTSSTSLPTEQPLTKFYVYAHYNHGGDLRAAARELGARGYGTSVRTTPGNAVAVIETSTRGLEEVEGEYAPAVLSDGREIDLGGEYGDTDVDNGRRYIEVADGQFRYAPDLKQWRYWDGEQWRVDRDEIMVQRYAVRITDEMLAQARATGNKELEKAAHRSRSKVRINAMVWAARLDCSTPSELFDANLNLFNLKNGTYNLETDELQPHNRDDLLTNMAGAAYDPDAKAPTWQKYLDEVLPDKEMQDFLQRMTGYSIMGKPVERALAVLHGPGGTGKSRFIETLVEVLGTYAVTTPASLFHAGRQDNGGPTNDLNTLRDKRFASTSELDSNVQMNESLVKRLTGFDRITSRGLYQENSTWIPQCVIWLATNHHFRINSDDGAIWERIKVITFDKRIDPKKRDPFLGDKLKAEADGILLWILEGVRKYKARGLEAPAGVEEALESYKQEQDRALQFIQDSVAEHQLVVSPDAEIKKSLLYQRFTNWCKDQGEIPLGKLRFNRRMKALGFTEFKRSDMHWRGVGVQDGAFILGS